MELERIWSSHGTHRGSILKKFGFSLKLIRVAGCSSRAPRRVVLCNLSLPFVAHVLNGHCLSHSSCHYHGRWPNSFIPCVVLEIEGPIQTPICCNPMYGASETLKPENLSPISHPNPCFHFISAKQLAACDPSRYRGLGGSAEVSRGTITKVYVRVRVKGLGHHYKCIGIVMRIHSPTPLRTRKAKFASRITKTT